MIFLITVNLVVYNSSTCPRKDILDTGKKLMQFFSNSEIFDLKNGNDYGWWVLFSCYYIIVLIAALNCQCVFILLLLISRPTGENKKSSSWKDKILLPPSLSKRPTGLWFRVCLGSLGYSVSSIERKANLLFLAQCLRLCILQSSTLKKILHSGLK